MSKLARSPGLGLGAVAFCAAIVACSGPSRDGRSTGASRADTPEAACGSCHPQHVAEWMTSSHAYAMHDPVFQAMVQLGQRQTDGALGDFCVKCHTPIGTLEGATRVLRDDAGSYTQRITGLDESAMGGVTCLVCHSITAVNDTFNAGFDLSLDGIRRGPIMNPAATPAHQSQYSQLHTDSKLCGTCHDVLNPKNVLLERTHVEWVQSIFAGSKSCQDCHMPEYQGPAATGHATRTVHQHAFVGVDVSLLAEGEFPGYDDQRARTERLLQSSAELAATTVSSEKRLEVSIHNLAGHALPSGATADREMWIELVVRDATSAVAFETGTLDARGDLRVEDPDRTLSPGTDPALVLYAQQMFFDPGHDGGAFLADGGASQRRRVDFLWEPNSMIENLIPPGATDRRSFDLGGLPAGHYSARVRLLFRSFPPHLLRKLEALAGLDPHVKERVPVVEMASTSVDFDL